MENKCQKCALLNEWYELVKKVDDSERNYWICTELFSWLHNNQDKCDGFEHEPKYEKYIIFGYDGYDKCGGLEDIRDSKDMIRDALVTAEKLNYFFVKVVDRDTWEVVWEK